MMRAVAEAGAIPVEDWTRRLAAQLRAWLPKQRWFAGKGRPDTGVSVAEAADCGHGHFWLLAAAGAGAAAQSAALYQLLVRRGSGGEIALDALREKAVRQWWFDRIAETGELGGQHGMLRFEAFAPGLSSDSSRLGSAEQSNTSILYCDRKGRPLWVLKFFRHLLAGDNPEFEVPRALAAHTAFRHVPEPVGRVMYRTETLDYTVATLQPFIPNLGDGWEYVLGELRSQEPRPQLRAEIGLLGRRTAELHLALASIGAAAFAPEPVTATDLEHWRERALSGASAALLDAYQDVLAPWRQRLAASRTGLDGSLGCGKIRLHGDYHLGQVLKTADDFYLFDFEGEPVRPLEERRRKGCALQDVAGMLRSFGYAAATAGRPEWEAEARSAFLDAYREALEAGRAASPGLDLAPSRPEEFLAVLRFFEFEKAVYELAYEISHRPDWVRVPLEALRRMNG